MKGETKTKKKNELKIYKTKHDCGVFNNNKKTISTVQDMKMCNYVPAKPQWFGSSQRDDVGL